MKEFKKWLEKQDDFVNPRSAWKAALEWALSNKAEIIRAGVLSEWPVEVVFTNIIEDELEEN